jgi:dihydrodipicolinate synthase/N-acetylneuraminate lyase
MQPSPLPLPLRGIVPPMVTPLMDPETLDVPGVERLIDHILSAEVSGLFVLGTTGEGPSLGYRVRQELIEVACECVAGRVPVLVGVSDSAFAESVGLAEFAADAGASAVVLAPPYYYATRQEELALHVEHFAAESPLPVFLYNLPSLTKTTFEPDTVRRLMQTPNIVGLKDSSANMIYFHSLRRLAGARPDWSLLVGPEELLAESVLLGGDGGVCGGANLYPQLYVDLYRAARGGDVPLARKLHDDVMHIAANLYSLPSHGAPVTAAVKGVLACWGICRDVLAEPFGPLSEIHRRQVRERLEALGESWTSPPVAAGASDRAGRSKTDRLASAIPDPMAR